MDTALRYALQPTQECVCSSLRRASRAMTQHFEKHFKGSGLRSTQFTVLSTIAQAGPQPITRLADVLSLERTALGRAVRPLAHRGLVKIVSEGDARERIVSITAEGRATLHELLPRWQAAQRGSRAVLKKLSLPAS
ncbi:MAG: MarR family transcriptional regulator [Caldimonas sp.]